MAEGLNRGPRVTHASEEHTAERRLVTSAGVRGGSGGSARPASPHSGKFLIATVILAMLAIAAVAVFVGVIATPHHTTSSAAWSDWSPPDNGLAGEREIADEVSPFYRESAASQLDVVTVQNIAAPSSSSTGSGTQIALRDPSTGSLSEVSGSSAVYNLCGLGPSCAIAGGTPTANRLLLLRREALELTLYTFKYIKSVQNVVAILPPGKTTQTCTGICSSPNPPKTTKTVELAVVFQRQSLQHFLQEPLRDTLPESLPPSISQISAAPEAELVSVITGQALFDQQLVQSQDGGNVLVLNPQPPQ